MATQWRAIDIARSRLVAQRIHQPVSTGPLETVTHLTAMQGQDLPGVLWSIGLRTPDATEADVRAAFDRGELVRSWPMRGTLHVTTPDDLRLILPLSRHRLVTSFATRHRELGITPDDVTAATDAGVRALTDGPLVRKALLAVFEAAGQSIAGQRGIHLLSALAHAGLICLGPFVGKEQAFVLLDAWAPPARRPPERDEALAELAFRYFTSHGPATEADFAWWANLTLTDVRAAIHNIADRLGSVTIDTTTWYGPTEVLALERPLPGGRSVHALPGFDENLLGYTDRSAALAAAHSQLIVPGNNGMFKSTIVAGGRVVGTWSRAEKPTSIHLTAMPFTELGTGTRSAFAGAARRYGRFKGKAVELTFSPVGADPARL
ncbi:MAG: winged helix DNA-binding domain-containing protein [Mycetocola sp.]